MPTGPKTRMSLQLFSYLSNEIIKEMNRCDKHGVQLMPDKTVILSQMFADDVLLSDTTSGLQNQLDTLSRK